METENNAWYLLSFLAQEHVFLSLSWLLSVWFIALWGTKLAWSHGNGYFVEQPTSLRKINLSRVLVRESNVLYWVFFHNFLLRISFEVKCKKGNMFLKKKSFINTKMSVNMSLHETLMLFVCYWVSAVYCLEAPVSFDMIYYQTMLYQGWLISIQFTSTFLCPTINLHGKWRSHFATTKPHCIVGVICLEVSSEIKNLSTYSLCFKAISSPAITHCVWSIRATHALQEFKTV